MTNNNSIHANNPQHRLSSPQHNDNNAAQQQTAGTASRTPQTPQDEVFQNPHILHRIIELSDSPQNTAKNLHPVNKAFRQASIITQQGQSLKSFSAQDLLNAFSQAPQTRNNSPLGNYLQKAPKNCPFPDIDITLSPEDLNNNDILSSLRNLQSNNTTSPIKAVIELNNPSELQSLIRAQLPFIQSNPSILRAIHIKEEVSVSQLQNHISLLAQKLYYNTRSKLTPTLESIPLKISLNILFIYHFLDTDLTTLPENIHISSLTIRNPCNTQSTIRSPQAAHFEQQLHALRHITSLNLHFGIHENTTFTSPASVTTLTMKDIDGTLLFAPDSQCSSLSLGDINSTATVTIPPSVTKLSTDNIFGTLLFAHGSQCSSLSINDIYSAVTIPTSVTSLITGSMKGSLLFARGSQCSTLSLGLILPKDTLTIPASVSKLTTGDIYGTLSFAPDSQCSSLSLGHIYSEATVTIPSSVTTLTTGYIYGTLQFAPGSQCSSLAINNQTFTDQALLDFKSGKTSLPNVTFEQQ